MSTNRNKIQTGKEKMNARNELLNFKKIIICRNNGTSKLRHVEITACRNYGMSILWYVEITVRRNYGTFQTMFCRSIGIELSKHGHVLDKLSKEWTVP